MTDSYLHHQKILLEISQKMYKIESFLLRNLDELNKERIKGVQVELKQIETMLIFLLESNIYAELMMQLLIHMKNINIILKKINRE
ncbi:hypothetical protein LW858_29175 (plasmid) [Bacillus cereus]|uniref:hypothetical protein n=1 Tax=Bacillus cereus TaxID=1396 RepID=UPI001F2B4C75|nr:hypothetical protein [Bacillus cereus]UIJ69666.1 hypothetical protein LW858_29175 [Bacillus cereus]